MNATAALPDARPRQARVVFLNRFFHPDHSATSQMLSDLAFGLAREGVEVHVVTSRLRYDDPKARLAPDETVNGVRVHRVWTSRFGRGGLFGRGADYLSFYLTAFIACLRVVRRADTLVAMTDPPMVSVMAAVVAKLRRASLVTWLQDLFPEIAAAAGIRTAHGLSGKVLRGLRDWSLHAATRNVVIGELMRERLLARGIAPEQIELITNWADTDAIVPVPHAENPLRKAWGFDGCFVVGYSGNMGFAHEFDTLLGAAELLRDEPQVRFLLIGGGKHLPHLQQEVARRGLAERVVFKPYQRRDVLKYSLGAADMHLVSLRPELEGLIVPSKFYGIVAAGRVPVFVGSEEGEVARYLRGTEAGVVVAPGDSQGLAAAVRRCRRELTDRGAAGGQVEREGGQRFSQRAALLRWAEVVRLGAGERMGEAAGVVTGGD